MENLNFDYIIGQLKLMGFRDVIDILIVAALFFLVYTFIRDKRAGKLAVGIFFVVAIGGISKLCGFQATSAVLTSLLSAGLVALVVVFQPELRSALEKMGSEPMKGLKKVGDIKGIGKATMNEAISQIASACYDMSSTYTGALIVIEKTTNLDSVVKGGKKVNADVTATLLKNIFYKGAPLHDGAVIVRDCRIYLAGCILPLSTTDYKVKNLGTRHHAALGISEESDAVTVVVSEETGAVSLAYDGEIFRNLSKNELINKMQRILETTTETKKKAKGGNV